MRAESFLCGNLVTLQQVCGKEGRKWAQGQLHSGLCVALRVGDKRRMLHVPQALELSVRRWVNIYQEAWGLMEEIFQSYLSWAGERFVLRGEKRP